MKLIVADASSLILLTRADITGILAGEFELIIPEKVYQECVHEEAIKRFPDALQIQEWVHEKKIEVRKADVRKVPVIYKISLGEKEAIALSLELPESLFLTDDGNAIKVAKYLKKSFIISPVLVVDLYRLEKISYETAKRAIEKLSMIGRYLPNLIADIFLMLESARTEKERK